MEESQDTIGYQLKQARKKCGLTQQELKEACGVSTFTISGLERGTIENVSTYTLKQLQNALNMKFKI